MAKQVDPCMFCGELPCVCNGPVEKKSAPKKRKPKPKPQVEVDTKPEASASRPPKKRAPLNAPKERGTKEIKRERRSGAPKIDAVAERRRRTATQRSAVAIPDDELEQAVRVLDFVGLLHPSERSKHRRLLERPAPTGRLFSSDMGRRDTGEGGEQDERE